MVSTGSLSRRGFPSGGNGRSGTDRSVRTPYL
jgi:hypothetical protein